MNCNICLKPLRKAEGMPFHLSCVRSLFPGIKGEPRIPGRANEFAQRARKKLQGGRFSISGVQPKVGVIVIDGGLELAARGSTYIAKPCPGDFPHLPEVEHLSMEICRLHDESVAACGLVRYARSKGFCYITRRYDRQDSGERVHQEDLLGAMGIANTDQDVKYGYSYEFCLQFLLRTCGPEIAQQFMHRLLLMYYIGNGDLHLKNISLFPHEGGKLTPIYDAVNTDIYEIPHALALDLFEDDYEPEHDFGYFLGFDFLVLGQRVGLNYESMVGFILQLTERHMKALLLVQRSPIPKSKRERYTRTLNERLRALMHIDLPEASAAG